MFESMEHITPRLLLSLAPMAGYTNLAFRVLVRQIGGVDFTTTELVNARSLIEGDRKAIQLISLSQEDRPCAIQLFGNKPAEMGEAARIAEASGAACIDINMGCPARKVVNNGGGSALLATPELALQVASQVVQSVNIPVTVKMRLGFDPEHIVAPELGHAFQEIGIQAITIHGRTRSQGFSGGISLVGIRSVVEAAPRIPVFGNGDITTAENAAIMLQETGCKGVAIGRGAFYNPWIFQQIRQESSGKGSFPGADFEMRMGFMRRHLLGMIEVYGEALACSQFRKIAPFYTRRMGPSREINREFCQCNTYAQFQEIMECYRARRQYYLDENGNLKSRYQPVAVHSSLDERTKTD